MSFRHDSTGISADTEFELLPEDWYAFRIHDAEEQESSKGNDMILCKCRVINNQKYKDAEIWHYVTFLPKENKGAGISVQFRKCIGVAHGGNDIVDAEEWKGKTFLGFVVQDTYEGKTRNKIAKVAPPSGPESAASPSPAVDEEVPF